MMRFLSDEQYEDVLHVAGMMPHIVPTVTPHGEFVLFFNIYPQLSSGIFTNPFPYTAGDDFPDFTLSHPEALP